MGSTYGKLLKISIFGESHGNGIGVVIDGFPSGVEYDEAFILSELSRRSPSDAPGSTARREADLPEILSGIYNGKTTGTPICAVIRNEDTRSGDYTLFARTPRPGHADFTGDIRYNSCQDPRGGGHFSGRLTAPLVFAGALSKLALKKRGITIDARIQRIGNMCAESTDGLSDEMIRLIKDVSAQGDSIGGCVECTVLGAPAGIGSPIFDAVESRLSSILFAIPGVHGVEFGSGFAGASLLGSQNNDSFVIENGEVTTKTNNHGGVLGGITSGMPIVFNCAFKPTASIFKEQQTVDLEEMSQTTLQIKGRHDPCIVIRAVPVVESAAAICMLDMLLEAYGYEGLK